MDIAADAFVPKRRIGESNSQPVCCESCAMASFDVSPSTVLGVAACCAAGLSCFATEPLPRLGHSGFDL